MACIIRPAVVSLAVRSCILSRPLSKSLGRGRLLHKGLKSAVPPRLVGKFHGGHVEGLNSLRHGFCVRASDVSEPGSVDSPMMQAMQNKIKEQLNAEEVIVKDAYGDGRHVSIDVISSAFEGQSQVNRQRMVYKAIWEEMQSVVHAVDQMTTKTPAEVADASK